MSYNMLPSNKEFKSLIERSSKIAIVCAERGSDSVASGIALSKYLKQKYRKHASLYYSGDISLIPSKLRNLETIENNFNRRSLRVTLDYEGTDISSVDYYNEAESSKLIIDINSVGIDFNIDRIKYDFIGSDFDLIITIGSSNLHSLGYIYEENRDIFNRAKIINIDNSGSNENFGTINIVDAKADSLSGLLLQLFSTFGFVVDKNISKILLLGLSE